MGFRGLVVRRDPIRSGEEHIERGFARKDRRLWTMASQYVGRVGGWQRRRRESGRGTRSAEWLIRTGA